MKHKVYIRSIACQTRYIPPQPQIVPAVIGAGVALGSILSGMATNSSNREEQQRVNRENMDFQREMFARKSAREDMLNANSALIQRQALEKAGLNPNIGNYGEVQTNVTQGSSSSQSYQAQNPFTGSDAGALASLIQNQPLVNAEVEKKKAEKNLIEKQSGVAEADELLKRAQAWSINELTPEQKKNLEESNKKLIAETEKINVDKDLVQKTIDKTLEETDALRIQNNLLMAETPLILQQMATNIALMYAQGQLADAQTAVAYKSLFVMSAQITELISRAHLNKEQAKYVSNLAMKAWIDSTFSPFEHLKGISLTQAQIDEVRQTFENLKQHNAWVPFNNIVGAYTGVVGSASGAIRAGLGMGSAGN